jgi:hypothetical protein
MAYAAGNADVHELPIRADAARIHDLLAEAAVTPLPGCVGLTEQRAEELISEIPASRMTRYSLSGGWLPKLAGRRFSVPGTGMVSAGLGGGRRSSRQ